MTRLAPKPKISVLVPAYNGAPFLGEAIDSVLGQTLQDFELIIADDGSSDGTQEIGRRYAQQDSRVSFYENERNLGCVRNINQLILQSRGQYIKILIQDDVLSSDYLECFAGILDTHPDVSLVTSFQRFIGGQSEVRKMPTLPAIGKLDGRRVQRHLLAHGNWIGGETAVMMRRSNLSVGLFNPDWVWQVDQDLWLRMLATSNLFVVPKILSFPRIHGQQGTVTLNKGYTFIREELIQLKTAFMAPALYGTYSKEDQRRLYERHLVRLVEKGLVSGDRVSRDSMMEIGHEVAGSLFWRVFARMWIDRNLKPLLGAGLFMRWKLRLAAYISSYKDQSWKDRLGFKPRPAIADLGFGTIETFGEIRVPVELLRSPVMMPFGLRVFRLEQTPHYRWIKDLVDRRDDTASRNDYRQYLELYHPDEAIEGTIAKISRLVESIREESAKGESVTIVTHPPAHYRGEFCAVIYDGNHRASIAKALGHEHVTSQLVNIRMNSDYFPLNDFEAQTPGDPKTVPSTP